ncbi:S2-RNase [Pyrus ussuriensis x Pyrus communis]|uniref:S2-RNase n=1 Tax=Pyrus ussuriensis x Pyrus communis TaxID=2448454 RepID=A0A5N5I934_9ROSA|nr:S2-RNase [Pyrus ussuriensis x Pyrus communis]
MSKSSLNNFSEMCVGMTFELLVDPKPANPSQSSRCIVETLDAKRIAPIYSWKDLDASRHVRVKHLELFILCFLIVEYSLIRQSFRSKLILKYELLGLRLLEQDDGGIIAQYDPTQLGAVESMTRLRRHFLLRSALLQWF